MELFSHTTFVVYGIKLSTQINVLAYDPGNTSETRFVFNFYIYLLII